MPGLIREVELMAIYRARGHRRARLFSDWLEQRGRPMILRTLRRVANRRSQDFLLADEGFVEDAVAMASFAAWDAIIGYRWFCPHCKGPSPRYGSKVHVSYARKAQLAAHLRQHHEGDGTAPPISRRVFYLVGSNVGHQLVARSRYAQRYLLSTDERLQRIEVEDRSALYQLAALERYLDRERQLVLLTPQDKLLASVLLSGMSLEDAGEVCSAATRRI